MLTEYKSSMKVISGIATEDNARFYLATKRWGIDRNCPKCGAQDMKHSDGCVFECSKCKESFNVRDNTIFEEGGILLRDWFIVIVTFNCLQTPKGKKTPNIELICNVVGLDFSVVSGMIGKINRHIAIYGPDSWALNINEAKNAAPPVPVEIIADKPKPEPIVEINNEVKPEPITWEQPPPPVFASVEEKKPEVDSNTYWREWAAQQKLNEEKIFTKYLTKGEKQVLFNFWLRVVEELDVLMDDVTKKIKSYAPDEYLPVGEDWFMWCDHSDYTQKDIVYPDSIKENIKELHGHIVRKTMEIIDVKNGHSK